MKKFEGLRLYNGDECPECGRYAYFEGRCSSCGLDTTDGRD